jgi:cytochrome c
MPTFLERIIPYAISRSDAVAPNRSAFRIGRGRAAKVFSLFFVVAVSASDRVAGADAVAAQDLAKASGCFKCHGLDKKKDGPALRDAAAKFKGRDDAEDKLIYHVTSGERVKFPDGHEEEHKKVKTNDLNQTKNLVRWILSLEGGTTY